jgi:hypothetical protein
MAVVDARHQVIVGAQAFGAAQEHGLLIPIREAGVRNKPTEDSKQKTRAVTRPPRARLAAAGFFYRLVRRAFSSVIPCHL